MKKISLIAAFTLLIFTMAMANNVTVTSVSTTGKTTVGALSTHYTNIQFNINWANSWRTSTNESNYDGCWIFVKYRKQSTSVWLHATLNGTGQTAPTGSALKPSADGKGAWIYRSADGIGDVSFNNAQLRWNYGADGVLDNENVEIMVYAVEMVYVPQGTFNLGNASAEINKFRDGAVNTWFPITSEAAITCGTSAGNLFASNSFLASGTIPAAFPKGYNAFWVMKYEFSNQQYVDFLNTLDQTNANTRNVVGATGNVPNMAVANPEWAVYSLRVDDYVAWLDWAAMRPLTEFEYEKACRGGNNTPSPLEFAWGNTTITPISVVSNAGQPNESWANGNANYGGGPGRPMRTGALATATSNRTSSGASFYGIMELSGNAAEIVVYAGNVNGRNFNGSHGDGVLTATAEANTNTWPNSTINNGMTYRGGYFSNAVTQLQISDRSVGEFFYGTPSGITGGRGVRSGE